jgi:hypothetical protein
VTGDAGVPSDGSTPDGEAPSVDDPTESADPTDAGTTDAGIVSNPEFSDGGPTEPPCIASTEVCNSVDDDCDGIIDEGGPDICDGGAHTQALCWFGTCTNWCDAGYDDCDGTSSTGCEQSTRQLENCGGCGITCGFDNGTADCFTGSCRFGGCDDGFSSCDSNEINGCEVEHAELNGSLCVGLSSATATLCGDDGSAVRTYSGRSSQWFRFRSEECSNGIDKLHHRVRLNVPSGTNYDLFMWKDSCGGGSDESSTSSGSGNEEVQFQEGDSWGSDDSFNFYIEVRHISGESCQDWSLVVEETDNWF